MMGRVSEYVNREYGFPCQTVEGVLALVAAAAPVQVLPNNPNRVAWIIFNLGVGLSAVAFSPLVSDVAPFYGIRMAAAGGMAASLAREDGELPTLAIYGMSTVGTNLYILQTVAVS